MTTVRDFETGDKMQLPLVMLVVIVVDAEELIVLTNSLRYITFRTFQLSNQITTITYIDFFPQLCLR